MKQQTAVEWLKQQYIERGETLPSGVFQEAKAIEKEQIENAFSNGAEWEKYEGTFDDKFEQYYKETYGKEMVS
jgi:hypothetical protein